MNMNRAVITAVFAGALSVLSGGCMFGKSGSSQEVYLSSGNGIDGFQRTVYAYARTACISCHGGFQDPKFAVDSLQNAYNVAVNYANFSQIPYSKFVAKTQDGHCGPTCQTDGSNMIALITQWAQYGAPTGGPGISLGHVFTKPLPVPSPNSNCNLPDDLSCSIDGVSGGQPCTNTCWTKLRFPVAQMSPTPDASIQRAWFEVDFAYENYKTALGGASYVYRNPRVVIPDTTPIYIQDIKTWVNGTYHPTYGEAYQNVDTVVSQATFTSCTIPPAPTPFDPNSIGSSCIPSTQALFSTAASASGILQELDPATQGMDTLSFSFEYLQPGVVGNCKQLALWQTNVYTPIQNGLVSCLNCHKAGGQVTEAGQRFNMDITDPINNNPPNCVAGTSGCASDSNTRLLTVCTKFLQRSNLTQPAQSPIIVQPIQGLNGMPAQPNFSYFEPSWIDWITAEAKAAGK